MAFRLFLTESSETALKRLLCIGFVLSSVAGRLRILFHQAKIVRKTLIPTVFRLLNDFLFLKNDVNVASKSNKQKNLLPS
jgi:hypothetical protein